jgi:hypothetical protein
MASCSSSWRAANRWSQYETGEADVSPRLVGSEDAKCTRRVWGGVSGVDGVRENRGGIGTLCSGSGAVGGGVDDAVSGMGLVWCGRG